MNQTNFISIRSNDFSGEKLLSISKAEITDKGGFVSFSWWLEQCGTDFWWTCKGYVDNTPIKIKVSN